MTEDIPSANERVLGSYHIRRVNAGSNTSGYPIDLISRESRICRSMVSSEAFLDVAFGNAGNFAGSEIFPDKQSVHFPKGYGSEFDFCAGLGWHRRRPIHLLSRYSDEWRLACRLSN